MPTKTTVSKTDLIREMQILDRVTEALNTAVVALMYVMNIKGDELKGVKMEDYVKFAQEHVGPFMIEADRIVKEAAAQAKEDMDKEAKKLVKKAKKEKKNA